jgi:NAD(P)H dehydrogenase (quinone)
MAAPGTAQFTFRGGTIFALQRVGLKGILGDVDANSDIFPHGRPSSWWRSSDHRAVVRHLHLLPGSWLGTEVWRTSPRPTTEAGQNRPPRLLEKSLRGDQGQAMHAHFVLAHPEPQSFNAHLVRSGSAALEAEGWTTSVSDLYAMGFDPCERPEHYRDRAALLRFDAQLEQRHASENGGLPKAVTDELAILDRADLLVLQYPMWWHLPPAMLKGWFDRVLAYGAAYTSKKRFERGRFVGKRAMLSVTVGTGRSTYEHDGRSGDINLMLWPVNFTLAYVGYDVVAPYVAYGVEAGLRYSDPAAVEGRLRTIVADFRAALPRIGRRDTIAFNRMEEWGPDGRLAPGAPVHSPYIRRRQQLELE